MHTTHWILPVALLLAVVALEWTAPGLAGAGATPLTTIRVATGLDRPVGLVAPPADTTRLFILEQYTGRVRILDLATGVVRPKPFLTQTGVATGGEQGLLGMAFHPLYPESGYVYINYTRTPDGANVIKRYTVSGNPDIADPSTGAVLLTVPKPTGGANHNAGWLGFGADGNLYVPMGDGGGFNNPGYFAQDDTTRYGKILRLDVDGAFPYAIPADNPFAGSPSPRNEFWVKGLRNPWRCSFDRATDDFYIADVGAGLWEEIDYQPASSPGGENYGWNKFEGYVRYICPDPCDSTGLTRPIHVYDHEDFRGAIIGGPVYRGPSIPDLQGAYFFADYGSAQIWTLRVVDGAATEVMDRTAELDPPGSLDIIFPSSFGEDARGEIYVCDHPHGEVFRIVAAGTPVSPPDPAAGGLVMSVAPNPSANGFTLHADFTGHAPTSVRVYDAVGRHVRLVAGPSFALGPTPVSWDGRDDGGRPVASGVYFIWVAEGMRTDVRKVEVIR